MPSGKIIGAVDHGSIWQVLYKSRKGVSYVNFDHRPFADFYEGATGGDFFRDYDFGRGREFVSKQLAGIRIRVEGEPYEETVFLEANSR